MTIQAKSDVFMMFPRERDSQMGLDSEGIAIYLR
jgi:hypothetical protein